MPRRPQHPLTGDPVIDTGAPLTQKERKLVEGVVNGLPKMTAAIQAGYSTETARSDASRILSQPLVQAHWREVLAAVGLTTLERAQLLAEAAREATTMIVDKNGQEHFNRDYKVTVDAVRVAGMLDGSIGPRQAEGSGGTTVNITIDNRALPSTDAIDVTPES